MKKYAFVKRALIGMLVVIMVPFENSFTANFSS